MMQGTNHSGRALGEELANWKQLVRPYHGADNRKAAWQVVNTLIPLVAMWTATFLSLRVSIWLTALLAIPTAFLVSRVFIFQHDCGHNSFVRTRRGNDIIGFACSLITSIPYHYWAKVHRFHHKHNGAFEGRGIGDVPFLRVNEYRKLEGWQKLIYRMCQSPIFMFGIAPLLYLFVSQRLPITPLTNPKKTIRRQLFNNLTIATLYLGLASFLGFREFLIVQGMVLSGFAVIAFWVFHVQHLHEHTLKQESSDWSHLTSAIRGSSHYDLSAILHWLTGNIGIHHIHHLSTAIPNYKLQQCFREQPLLTKHATSITLRESLAQIHSDLWDDQEQRMISFSELSQRDAASATYVYEPNTLSGWGFRSEATIQD